MGWPNTQRKPSPKTGMCAIIAWVLAMGAPTAIDLFSGCGGLTLGLKLAGFAVCGALDVDPLSVETYRLNHPEVRAWELDIRQADPRTLARALSLRPGALDLLAGCPPCQGFSAIRTLNGSRSVDDPRNDLLADFLRFVEALHPQTVMMENVPALAGDDRLTRLETRLKQLEYRVTHAVLDAADFGVPQRRRRLLLLASRGRLPDVAPSPTLRRTVRDAIAHLPPPGASGDALHDILEQRSEAVKDLIRSIPRDGGSRWQLGADRQLPCHRRCNGFRDVYGRMAWDDVAPTITAGCTNPSKGRFLHPEQDRAISLREAALLQSFPPRYHISLARGKHAAAGLIGNALPPAMIARVTHAVLSQLR
jgi:DNA (cytosine-5)-methyltransferase 1